MNALERKAIRVLSAEAAEARDWATVAICDLALGLIGDTEVDAAELARIKPLRDGPLTQAWAFNQCLKLAR